MARPARVVAAGVPHHVTQRRNRRQTTFFGAEDHTLYRQFLATWCQRHDVAVCA
ncbi:MAG: hypothetical protein WAS21_31210 [Geminicoccaceae bacterium]